ncbi:helix-turn-helix domain-containing protein [Nocardia farcinica]|uniref:AraC-like ligand-binding domain-containing protein n=1 Tax=Nocardia farcinica TaxID=37329 RepID=UPI002454B918|nr:helix-turn-helix domain-containing protein [Nocardia farcinica]
MSTLAPAATPPSAERFDTWQETISHAFVPLTATPLTAAGFDGTLSCHEVGSLQLNEVGGGPVRVERDPRAIRRADPGYIKLGLQTRGRGAVVQDGRTAVLGPGDLAVYDTGRPYTLHFDQPFQMIVAMFPRESWQIRAAELTEITARRIGGRGGVGALLAPFLRAIPATLACGDLSRDIHIADAVLDLLTAAVTEFGGVEERARSAGAGLLVQVKAFIDAHLADPMLSVSDIAAAHHISVRYLQRLFETEGTTVTTWIRQRRLERIRRDLADPRIDRSTSAVAARWGLADASHFSKLFKAAYGMTPRQYRLAASRPDHRAPVREWPNSCTPAHK